MALTGKYDLQVYATLLIYLAAAQFLCRYFQLLTQLCFSLCFVTFSFSVAAYVLFNSCLVFSYNKEIHLKCGSLAYELARHGTVLLTAAFTLKPPDHVLITQVCWPRSVRHCKALCDLTWGKWFTEVHVLKHAQEASYVCRTCDFGSLPVIVPAITPACIDSDMKISQCFVTSSWKLPLWSGVLCCWPQSVQWCVWQSQLLMTTALSENVSALCCESSRLKLLCYLLNNHCYYGSTQIFFSLLWLP